MAQWAWSFQPLSTGAPARRRMEKVDIKRSDPFLFFFLSPKYAGGDNPMFVFLSERKFARVYVTRGR